MIRQLEKKLAEIFHMMAKKQTCITLSLEKYIANIQKKIKCLDYFFTRYLESLEVWKLSAYKTKFVRVL